jgi:beta-lactamase superfamily II metal-dependent hydrolase
MISRVVALVATVLWTCSTAALEIRSVRTIEQIPNPPDTGHYRVHLIDVATGLAMLLQGSDWNLLYDGGSNDDSAGGRRSRLMAYLYEAIGPTGDNSCRPNSADYPKGPAGSPQLTVKHVFQSHPLKDHGVLLEDVIKCFRVENLWDSGAMNDTNFYRDLLVNAKDESDLTYHTARTPPANRTVTVKSKAITFAAGQWVQFSTGDSVTLDSNASFTILHADGMTHQDLNENSTAVRVDLGSMSLLLTGDVGSGSRHDPSAALGAVEENLVTNQASLIDVDILQVGLFAVNDSRTNRGV